MQTNKNKWYSFGLSFECIGCGRCCSGPNPGFIWVSRPEIKLIADFLKIPAGQLRKNYLRRIGFRLSIIEQPQNRDCIFLRKTAAGKECVIYPVRPNQCRTWPFWSGNLTSAEAWQQAGAKCPGINRGKLYSFDEIEKVRENKNWWNDQERKTADRCCCRL